MLKGDFESWSNVHLAVQTPVPMVGHSGSFDLKTGLQARACAASLDICLMDCDRTLKHISVETPG